MRRVLKIAARIVGCVLIVCVVAFAYFVYTPLPKPPRLTGRAQPATIRVGGRVRSYVEYVPAKLPPRSPLVIVLPALAMNGEMMRVATGFEFDSLADRNNFAVFYPEAYKGSWNDCRIHVRTAARLENIDDVGFIRALVAEAGLKFGVDANKVFAVGLSNGGHMALTLATQSPSPVAGIAVFGANLPTRDNSNCPQDTPTPPVMIVDGTDDPLSPYQGGESGLTKKGPVVSAPETAVEFARRNGLPTAAAEQSLPHRDPRDTTSVERFVWSRLGKPYVVLYAVHGGGHTLPQPVLRYPRLLGRTTSDIDGPALAIEFFLK